MAIGSSASAGECMAFSRTSSDSSARRSCGSFGMVLRLSDVIHTSNRPDVSIEKIYVRARLAVADCPTRRSRCSDPPFRQLTLMSQKLREGKRARVRQPWPSAAGRKRSIPSWYVSIAAGEHGHGWRALARASAVFTVKFLSHQG